MIGVSVRLDGADRALKALNILEPQVAKEVRKEISDIGRTMAAHITSLASANDSPPVSGWRGTPTWPAWGPVVGKSRRVGAGVVITSSSADPRVASMYEFIGNGTKIKTDRGRKLSEMMNERLGATVSNSRRKPPGRLIPPTLNEKYGEARRGLEEACDRAVEEVNRRMP